MSSSTRCTGCRALLLGGPAVRRARHASGLHLLPEPGHPDLEELIEVFREDRQEPDAFQQGVTRVAGLMKDARVELEPRELTVEVGERCPGTRRSTGTRCERGSGGAGIDGGHAVGGLLSVDRVSQDPAGEDSTTR